MYIQPIGWLSVKSYRLLAINLDVQLAFAQLAQTNQLYVYFTTLSVGNMNGKECERQTPRPSHFTVNC